MSAADDMKYLRRERERELKQRDRQMVRELKRRVAELRKQRPRRLAEVRELCRVGRVRAREQTMLLREQMRVELAKRVHDIRLSARTECEANRSRTRAELGAEIRQAEREARSEAFDVKRRYGRKGTKLSPFQKAQRRRELSSESDDAVRDNLPPELVPVFNKVRVMVKGKPGMSRTEAFLHWVHDHSDEVHAILFEQADRDVDKLIAQQEELERRLATGYHHDDVYASAVADPEGEVPF
jgi:hypothetical protein